jgi:hypothetical protein
MPRTIRFVNPPDGISDEVPMAASAAGEGAPRPMPELGPNAQAVTELLQRAATLSPAERRKLGEVGAWRWWPLTLPVGGSSASARANAFLAARRAGRKDAAAWVDSPGVAAALGPGSTDPLVLRAIGNAALAVLLRDVVAEEVFDVLYGPWREVTHR